MAEIEHLRQALDAETRRCLELQRQLDQANTDFETFISGAAHDLRESLRDVAAFSQLMAEADSDPSACLPHIREGAARMQSLLADVVDYWSIGSCDRRSSLVDMESVLDQALIRGSRQIAERSAVVTHDPLPPVSGDFNILTKVVEHLIRNAVEYCATPAPRVHVSCRSGGIECVFSVKDNGPGIDPAFHERIFGTFKRLHGREFPGNGLGLAYCKKAIECFGGRMWVESTTGAGSTFYFTLAAADSANSA